jgi:hypothetical protein
MRRKGRSSWRLPAIRISRSLAAALCLLFLALPAGAAEHAEDGGAPKVNGAGYVRFEPIFIPVINGNRVTQQVGVTLMLLLVKGENPADVEAKRPQLTDAFFRDLYGFFQQRPALGGRIDQMYLKSKLLKTASRIVGPKAVQEVLIEQLFARPS